MADIFISYDRRDRDKIRCLVGTLTQRGWTVWWDRAIPGGSEFRQEIQVALQSARCVIVAWSRSSVSSQWVRAEASEGMHRRVLVPVLLGQELSIPLPFGELHSIDLGGWNGDGNDPALAELVQAVESFTGPSAPGQARPSASMRRWWSNHIRNISPRIKLIYAVGAFASACVLAIVASGAISELAYEHAMHLRGEGSDQLALDWIRISLTLDPTNANARYSLGDAYQSQNPPDYKSALAQYDLIPNFYPARNNKLEIYLAQNRKNEVRELVETLSLSDPLGHSRRSKETIARNKGWAYFELGNFEKAKSLLANAGKDPTAQCLLALIKEESKQTSEAHAEPAECNQIGEVNPSFGRWLSVYWLPSARSAN